MRTPIHTTANIGDLVVAVFDEAERYGVSAREASRLATRAVAHLLRHARRIGKSTSPPSPMPFTRLSATR